jgi:hypothetical protein
MDDLENQKNASYLNNQPEFDEGIILSSMKKSNAVEKIRWGYKSRPLTNDKPVPTAVFHGISQVCTENMLTNLVEQIEKGTS